MEAAEKAKMDLSSLTQTSISLPFITATADGPKHIEANLTRAKFEEMCSDLLDRCRIPVQQAIKDAKLSVSDISEVRNKTLDCLSNHQNQNNGILRGEFCLSRDAKSCDPSV